ncbi:MAG: glycoside hydrolase family 127 protein [Pirellulales bacterium]|nr:glycoside hydrolase family 127 protein [Pirellulales bacterium]
MSLVVLGTACPRRLAAGDHCLAPVDPAEVKVGGEIGRRIDVTIDNNLLAIDVDRDFLERFRGKQAIARSGHPDRYVGLGKLIDAAVTFAAHTQNPGVIKLKDYLVGELIKTQLPDGYMGIFQPEHRVFALWDLHEMVYLIHGLVADFEHFGNKASLESARRLANYIIERRAATGEPRSVGKLNTERAFLRLHRATEDKKYLDYAVDGMDLRNWDQPVGGHAYTFMNVCLAQLDLYDIAPDESLLRQSRKVVDFLTARDGLLVNGTCSSGEGFHGDQRTTGTVGETCATAYLIRLLHAMLRIEGASAHGDIMERAIYNALFAAQMPDGRRLRYFTPLEGKRPVYEWDTYCCPNNYRRIVAELPQMIYYRSSDGGATVNLYTESSARVALDEGVALDVRQETDYPNSGQVTIHVDPSRPADFPLRLRIPAWCEKPSVSINGKQLDRPVQRGVFFTVSRQWKPGDRVELDMPMTWRLVHGRKSQDGRVAVMRGPMLFCLAPRRIAATDSPRTADRPLAERNAPNEGLAARSQSATVMRDLRLDPRSLGEPVHDATVRPDGLACPVRAWSPGKPATEPPDLSLRLTEFADPAGEATYFRVPDAASAVDDELVRGESSTR